MKNQLSIADITKEDSLFPCPCKSGTNATFYCAKGCLKSTNYYCISCSDPHDHKLVKIATEV